MALTFICTKNRTNKQNIRGSESCLSAVAIHFLCSSCPVVGPKGSHTFWSIFFRMKILLLSQHWILEALIYLSNISPEGAFFFFLFGYSVNDSSQIHAFWLHFVIQNSNQFRKLFPAVTTSYIDAYFLEGGKNPHGLAVCLPLNPLFW